jgi:hypothetical protein
MKNNETTDILNILHFAFCILHSIYELPNY